MNKYEVKKFLCSYLEKNNIFYISDYDNDVERITLVFYEYDNCPDKILEGCIWFYENEMEVRIYYDENSSSWSRKINNLNNLMRLFNYINSVVWPSNSRHLYVPRLYMTEDGYRDITLSSVITYDFYSISLLESSNYIIDYLPELLDSLSPAIFGVLFEKIDVKAAINYIKEYLLKENIERMLN